MVRTQIQLTEEQARILKALARKRDVSMSELIRQSVDRLIHAANEPTQAERVERLLSAAGKYASNVSDLSENHDRYLAEAYGTINK